MKKIYTRMAACFMAALLTFNIFAVPQAKASATVTMLAPAVLAAYAQSVGVGLTASSAGAVSSGMTAAIGGYAAATGTTSAAVSSSIAAGAAISTGGVIVLTVAACALLAGIVAWAVDEFGMEPGAEPVSVYSSNSYVSALESAGIVLASGFTGETWQIWAENGTKIMPGDSFELPNGVWVRCVESSTTVNMDFYRTNTDDSKIGPIVGQSVSDFDGFWLTFVNGYICAVIRSGREYCPGRVQFLFDAYSGVSNEERNLYASLAPDYEAPPTVDDQHSMVIDTGLTAADEQGLVDAILAGIADSSFAPTYTIEVDTSGDSGDDSGSDTGSTEEEKQTGFLGRIADGIDGLAEAIKNGIASLFTPDPALMAEITGTFSSKFGFMSDLHQLGSDLASIGPDTEPPVVYIHLEDAEGMFDYGGMVKALDMTWYERYKPDGDRIIGGFLWLGFLWLLFKRAAAIIRGAEMVSDIRPGICEREDFDDLDAWEMFKADHNLDDRGRPIF